MGACVLLFTLCPLSLSSSSSHLPPTTLPLLLSVAIPLLRVIIKVFRSKEWMNYWRHRQGLWFGRCEWKITPLFPSSIACLMKSKSWSHTRRKRVLYQERGPDVICNLSFPKWRLRQISLTLFPDAQMEGYWESWQCYRVSKKSTTIRNNTDVF